VDPFVIATTPAAAFEIPVSFVSHGFVTPHRIEPLDGDAGSEIPVALNAALVVWRFIEWAKKSATSVILAKTVPL